MDAVRVVDFIRVQRRNVVGSGSSGGTEGGPGIVSGSCTDTAAASGTVAQQFGAAQIAAGAAKTYYLQSNWWQTFANETEVYAGLSFTVHNPQGASVPESNGAPMGFPSNLHRPVRRQLHDREQLARSKSRP